MPQSLSKLYIHIIFSTKKRVGFLKNIQIREQMHSRLGTICREMCCKPLAIGGTENHVHILCVLSKNVLLTELIENLKKYSSKWIKTFDEFGIDNFYWQRGYGAFSVSRSNIRSVCSYIENQPDHHKKFSFQEELRLILQRHGISFDERYLWD